MNNDFLEKDSNRGGLISTMVKKISTIEEWIRKHNSVRHQGMADSGWIPVNETWTYASASTITIPTDGTTKYQKGMKIRLKQGAGYKYYVVSTVTATTITVLINTDYTVVNSAITDVSYSFIELPFGWPDKFNYAAVLTAQVGLVTAYVMNLAEYSTRGHEITINIDVTITTKGTAAGAGVLSIPISPLGTNIGLAREILLTGTFGYSQVDTSGSCIFYTYNSLTPFTSNGVRYSVRNTYRF